MIDDRMIPGAILAAGEGRRFFGKNKLLLPFRGRSLIYHVVREALSSRLEPVILVLGCEGGEVLRALGDLAGDPKLRVVENEEWPSGRASSVRAAISSLPQEAPGVVFLQGDMPLMTRGLIDLVLEGFLKSDALLSFPVYKGEKGHPVAFARELLPELARLQGDRSGLEVVRRHWTEAWKFPLAPELEPTQLDIDTLEDYERLLRLERKEGKIEALL